ncbi:MAG: hypothetical protein ACRELE_02495 [Gemmatimonadales bacterium]
MISLLLTLAAATPAPAAPVRYHLTTKSTTEVDMSAMGQGVQSFPMALSAFISVTVSDSGFGRVVHVVIDSSTFDAGPAAAYLPPAMSASPNGAVFHFYAVNGKPTTALVPSPATFQAAQLAPAITLLLPGLHSAKPGDSWSDTTRTDTTIAQTDVSATTAGTSVTTWTAKSADDGIRQLDGVTTSRAAVGGASMKMDLKMTGTVHATAPTGQLATAATAMSFGQASMNVAGNAIPMKMMVEISATLLP